MDGNERRKYILQVISENNMVYSATAFAKELHVSRQIIVGDVALLRASGYQILATPKGYMLAKQNEGCRFTIACCHNSLDTCDELYTIVDAGGTILDVIVEHPLYGQLCGQLNLQSRIDVDDFIADLQSTKTQLLSSLTDGIHLHNIQCASENVKAIIINQLNEKEYLLNNNH